MTDGKRKKYSQKERLRKIRRWRKWRKKKQMEIITNQNECADVVEL